MKKYFFRQRVIRFRKFLNKGYAAFCSMHRQVSIGTVGRRIADLELLKAGKAALISVCVLTPLALFADSAPPDDEDAAATLEVQEVSVTARQSQFLRESFRLVSILDASQFQSLPVLTVSDLLRYLPGIDLRERGPSGVQADLSMRGGTGRQVKVLLNGIDITDPQTDHYTMDIPVDISLVERIELLQGTNYAIDAFSGAINIITRSALVQQNQPTNQPTNQPRLADSIDASLSLKAGEYGLINPVAAVGIQKGGWWGNLSASYNRSEGYMYDTDYDICNIYLRSGYGGLNFQVGGQMKNAGANSFYTVKYPNQYDQTRTLVSSLDYTKNWTNGFGLLTSIYYRAHFDLFQTFRNGIDSEGNPAPDWYAGPNQTWTHTQGGKAEVSWHNDYLKTMAGIDVRDELINSTSLDNHNRVHLRYFAEQRLYVGKFTASAGASGVYNTQFGNDWALGANVSYEPLKRWKIFVNTNRAIRIPTFTDLYYHTATQQADENTRAEKAWQVELSSRYELPLEKNRLFYVTASSYYRWGRDIIDWVKSADVADVVWRSTNHSKVDAAGAEITIGIRGFNYLRRVELNYAFCDVRSDAGDMLSLYALDYLRHKAVATIEHKIYKGFGATWCLRVESRRGEYTDSSGIVVPYGTAVLLDGSLYWERQWLRLSLDCKNMTNQKYVDIGGVVQPQHWLAGMVQLRLP